NWRSTKADGPLSARTGNELLRATPTLARFVNRFLLRAKTPRQRSLNSSGWKRVFLSVVRRQFYAGVFLSSIGVTRLATSDVAANRPISVAATCSSAHHRAN